MIIMLWFIEGPVSTKDQKKARGIIELRGGVVEPPMKIQSESSNIPSGILR